MLEKNMKSLYEQAKQDASSIKEASALFNKTIMHNKDKIEIGFNIAKALTLFAVHKTPFALVEGAFNIVCDIAGKNTRYPQDYFNSNNGWRLLFSTEWRGVFTKILAKYPSHNLTFDFDKSSTVQVIDLPIGKVGYHKNHYDEVVYFNEKDASEKEFSDFLINEKIDELKSNVISINLKSEHEMSSINLVAEKTFPIQSAKSQFYTDYITKCFDLNLNRSIIFYGPPGTGKTTLAHTIITNLGLKTMIFRWTPSFNLESFLLIMRQFNIEAVIIDDFDQINTSNTLLGFLELLKKEVKVVIALVNSLKEFHPAILRPGRFDEIIKVDALDSKVIKSVLGDLSTEYYMKVKHWPIAYINELVIRSTLVSDPKILKKYHTELESRVKKQLDSLK